jgi:hypothetical protein
MLQKRYGRRRLQGVDCEAHVMDKTPHKLSLKELTLLARDVVKSEDRLVEVVGTVPGSGDADYAEVMLVGGQDQGQQAGRLTVGVFRSDPVADIRAYIAEKVRGSM